MSEPAKYVVPTDMLTGEWPGTRRCRRLPRRPPHPNGAHDMTDYPTIDPAAVHGGDVVRGTIQPFSRSEPFIVEGPVWIEHGEPLLGGWYLGEFTDLRLVSMGRCCAPPEPPLRVGDFVKGRRAHFEGQIVHVTDLTDHSPYCVGGHWYESDELRRIEPPVGWPVGVPTVVEGGTRWYVADDTGDYWALDRTMRPLTWADLLAAGGVPAQAVTR